MLEVGVPVTDPVVDWDLHSGPAPTAQQPLPLLLGLKAGWRERGLLLDQIAPAVYTASERFATVRVRSLEELVELQRGASSRWVERIASGLARFAPSTPLQPVAAAKGAVATPKLRGTVVAVIDDYCAFAHERFRWLDGQDRWQPRVVALWDQGRGEDAAVAPPWRRVTEFGYGREMNADDLRQLFADPRCVNGGAIDEDRLYRLVDHRGMDRLEAHGTHVLDLAAGADPRDEATANEPQIVFVQLPEAAVRDTSGHWLAVNVIDALRYVHERVDVEANLVVNLSYGALAGPHDGTQAIEQAIEHLHTLRPTNFALVLPAGNGFEARCHASAEAIPGAQVEFVMTVRADDPTHTFAEVWSATPAEADFWVVAPDGTRLDHHHPRLESVGGELIAELLLAPHRDASRARALLCMKPVVRSDGGNHHRLVGRWRLLAENRSATDDPVRFDAWIERDEPVRGPSSPQVWQATFVGASGARAQAEDRTATLNSIANGPSPIVVGAFQNTSVPEMCSYSGSGWSLATRAGPDVVALGDESAWQAGISAAGTRSAYRFRMRGTSVAAPQVARWVARWLSQQIRPQNVAQIKAALQRQAQSPVRDPSNLAAGLRSGDGLIG